MRTNEAAKEDLSQEMFWETAARTRLGKYLTETEIRFVSEAFEKSKASLVLDVGAGAGKFSLLAARSDVTVVSIDRVSYGLKRLRLKNKSISAIKADARSIPIKSDIIDAVFMIEVLDYIPELDSVINEIGRTLKKESSFIFSFGNKASVKQKIRLIKGKSYLHSYKSVLENLSRAGFAVRKKLGFNWLPFGRTSENPSIPLFVFLEKVFRLRKIPAFSPWVMVHATKTC